MAITTWCGQLSIATCIEASCARLAAEYREQQRGFELARVAGGYRYQTATDQIAYVERFLLSDHRARLTAAALETLAIVAYKQPISRAQIAAIRGVDPDGVLRTLQSRGYVDAVGRDPGPGQAVLFGTTAGFLERLARLLGADRNLLTDLRARLARPLTRRLDAIASCADRCLLSGCRLVRGCRLSTSAPAVSEQERRGGRDDHDDENDSHQSSEHCSPPVVPAKHRTCRQHLRTRRVASALSVEQGQST